jgi:dTMP kinase
MIIHQKPPGHFITVEGVDGSGKTTFIEALSQRLTSLNCDHIKTLEPGGCPFSLEIRETLFNYEDSHPDTQLMAMFTARHEHVQQVILPALIKQKLVLCDRFTDSTYVYQVYGLDASYQLFFDLEETIEQLVPIDLTFYLELDYEQLLERLQQRSALTENYIDKRIISDPLYYRNIIDGYGERINMFSDRFIYLNATESVDALVDKAVYHIERLKNKTADRHNCLKHQNSWLMKMLCRLIRK